MNKVFDPKTTENNICILAVDTSCDETSVAILEGRKVLANIVSSQVELHKKWGGVMPDVARRAHIENIPGSHSEALKRAKKEMSDIDLIAVTIGPGLAIDLEVGIQYCQKLAIEHNIPFLPINHMEGHLLSSLILNSKGNGPSDFLNEKNIASKQDISSQLFPALGLLISGKHTEIIYIEDFGKYKKLGKTLDDAAGEAFDKFGRMLGFGYPGGPIVSEFAKNGSSIPDIKIPIPMERSGDLNFSYSGLKTACLYRIKELRESGVKDSEWANDMCWEFVNSVAMSLILKLRMAFKQYPEVKSLFAGGGVYKSEQISRRIGIAARNHDKKYLLPEDKYRGDNAAMIAIAAWANLDSPDILTDSEEITEIDRIPRYGL
jgi:N6-L-threonylcarbamoyladenine synthase